MTQIVGSDQAEVLRERLIADLRSLDAICSEPVERAFRAVPRHVFVPEASLEQAYEAERAEITRRDADGVAVSSVSAARIQAFMLEQAGIEPGMRVLEVGSGGCNAALMAELAGPDGRVTTMDIDSEVTGRAKRLLAAAGYERVQVVQGDGEYGWPGGAPYDRIVVTAGAADLAPAWAGQLAAGGRVVVPLRVRGLSRSIAFEAGDGYLAGRCYELCGFVPMRGAGESRERLVVLHDDSGAGPVGLRVDDDRLVEGGRLREALAGPGADVWSGVTAGPGMAFDDLDLWLATALPGYALLAASRQARDQGVVASASPMGVSAVIDGGSFAYLTLRADADRTVFEFGARGHGPCASAVAGRLADEMRVWDGAHRGERAVFRAYPAGTADDRLPSGLVVNRRHYRITVSWPAGTGSFAGPGPAPAVV